MFQMSSKRFFMVGLILLLSRVSIAGVFEYSKNVYGLDAAACQTEASLLAEKISSAVSGKTEAAYCAPLSTGAFEVRVLTETETLPELELAVFGFGLLEYKYPGQKGAINKRYSVISDGGTFVRLGDCLKALPSYESLFQVQTGLVPVAAQCARLGGYRYVAQVDSFGKGAKHLYELNLDMGFASSSKESLFDITTYMSSLGATPTTVSEPSHFAQIKYFATSEFKFSASDFDRKNSFVEQEECLDALTVVLPALKKLNLSNLVSLRCGYDFGVSYKRAYSMGAVFDVVGAPGQKGPKMEILTYGNYPSYSECRSHISATKESYCAADMDIYGNFQGYSLNVIRLKKP